MFKQPYGSPHGSQPASKSQVEWRMKNIKKGMDFMQEEECYRDEIEMQKEGSSLASQRDET